MDQRDADADPRRKDDISILVVATMLRDHIERYDRDEKVKEERNRQDYLHTQTWRSQLDLVQRQQSETLAKILPQHNEMIQKIKENSQVLNEIAPNYRRGMWVLAAIVLGSISLILKALANHLGWHG